MAAKMFQATVLLILLGLHAVSANLNIAATTFPSPGPKKANTFVGTSDMIGSSLLGSGVPALLWVAVHSSDVTAVCQQMVGTGNLDFGLTITDSTTGDKEDLSVQITGTGGCEASPDESGTEMVWADNLGDAPL